MQEKFNNLANQSIYVAIEPHVRRLELRKPGLEGRAMMIDAETKAGISAPSSKANLLFVAVAKAHRIAPTDCSTSLAFAPGSADT